MLSIFSCACWPSVFLFWENVYLGLLLIFQLDCFLLLSCMSCLYERDTKHIHNLKNLTSMLIIVIIDTIISFGNTMKWVNSIIIAIVVFCYLYQLTIQYWEAAQIYMNILIQHSDEETEHINPLLYLSTSPSPRISTLLTSNTHILVLTLKFYMNEIKHNILFLSLFV